MGCVNPLFLVGQVVSRINPLFLADCVGLTRPAKNIELNGLTQ
jgi:hypothetical protein